METPRWLPPFQCFVVRRPACDSVRSTASEEGGPQQLDCNTAVEGSLCCFVFDSRAVPATQGSEARVQHFSRQLADTSTPRCGLVAGVHGWLAGRQIEVNDAGAVKYIGNPKYLLKSSKQKSGKEWINLSGGLLLNRPGSDLMTARLS